MRLSVTLVFLTVIPVLACSASEADGENSEFAVERLTLPGGENPIHLADMDGDGRLDLVSASETTGELSIRLGDGAGGFGAPRDYPAGVMPTWIDSADMNADGFRDLIVANHEQAYLTVALGDGTGGIARSERVALPPGVAPHAHMVRAIDLDGDGLTDIVVDSRDTEGLFVLLARRGEPLRYRARRVDAGGAPYLGFAAGDLDGDGAPDLVTPNSDHVAVLLNRGGQPLSLSLAQRVTAGAPFSAIVADVNGDGFPDLVTASEDAAGGLTMFANDGAGRFAAEPFARYPMRSGAKSLASGDLDGDGFADVIAAGWSGDLLVIIGGPSGTRLTRPTTEGLTAPWTIAVGDLDSDGKDDFIVADGASGEARRFSCSTGCTN